MVELFDSWVHLLGPLGYPLLGLCAFLEYVAPPFPGDTITLLGGAYVARGERSWVLVFLAVLLGSMAGICATWGLGRLLGRRVDRLPEGRVLPGITHAQLRRAQDLMRDRGAWLLVANRFMPTFRTVIYLAAGASHMPLSRVLALGTVSAVLWNGLLLGVGAAAGGNIEQLEDLFLRYRLTALAVVAILGLAVLLRLLRRRRLAAGGPHDGAQ